MKWGSTANCGEKCICCPFPPAVSQSEHEEQAGGDEVPRHLQMEFMFISFYSFTFSGSEIEHRTSHMLDKHHNQAASQTLSCFEF